MLPPLAQCPLNTARLIIVIRFAATTFKKIQSPTVIRRETELGEGAQNKEQMLLRRLLLLLLLSLG